MFNLKKLFAAKSVEPVVASMEQIVPELNINLTPKQKVELSEHLESVTFWLLAFTVFLFPLFFVPFLTNWFDPVKPVLLLVLDLAIIIFFLARASLIKKITLTRSPFDLPILLLPVITIISAWLTVNRTQSLLAESVFYLGLALLFFAVTTVVSEEKRIVNLIRAFLFSGALLSLSSIFQAIIFNFPQIPNFVLLSVNPTGSPVTQLAFLAVIFPLILGLYLEKKNWLHKILLTVILVGILFGGYNLLKGGVTLLPPATGWKIATGVLGESPLRAIFGAGAGNFIDAYTAYKPASVNLTPYWNLRFLAGANYYLYLLTIFGLAGLAVFLWLNGKLLFLTRKRLDLADTSPLEKGLFAGLILALVIMLVIPGPQTVLVEFFVILSLLIAHFRLLDNPLLAREQVINLPENVLLRSILPLIVVGAGIYFLRFPVKSLLASYYFTQSQIAAAQNLGVQTYNLQIQAINADPTNDSYHAVYAQTNLALANSLAAQGGTNSAQLTDQQKQAVTQLVQQAIREGRNAVALAPNRAANWENLFLIYRSLINFAQGADQWALASINQAINLDPVNPQLKLELGGLYFAGQNYQLAAREFALAANLKPDLANSHYNLAQALKNLKLNDQATTELQTVANLICANDQSADCQQIKKEIADLTTPPATASSQLVTASPSAQPNSLPKAKTVPAPKISSPSGEIQP